MLKGLACGGTPALAMNGHMLKLASGGCLNLNELPPQEGVTLEMLQACRDRIFLLESQAAAAGPVVGAAKGLASVRSIGGSCLDWPLCWSMSMSLLLMSSWV